MSVLCLPCLERHGAAQECVATHEAEDGSPICVFCLDGEPCPYDRKLLALAKRSQRTEEEIMNHESSDQAAATPPTVPCARICGKAGCGRKLHRTNKSGFCESHFYLSRPKKRNGHAAANSANGHVAKSEKNGKGAPHAITGKVIQNQLLEERINGVMLAWSIAEKKRILNA